MKTRSVLLALGVLSAASLPSVAAAACYMIYNPGNELVWRATTPPVPMDHGALSAAVHQRVPGGHLVISHNDAAPCPPLDLTGPRLTMPQKAAQMRGE